MNSFFHQYYISILQDTFYVLTDTDHKSGFKIQSVLLARMFQLVEANIITAPLFDPTQFPDPNMTNAQFVRDYSCNLLQSAFPHVQRLVIVIAVSHILVKTFAITQCTSPAVCAQPG
jgi:exportin-1